MTTTGHLFCSGALAAALLLLPGCGTGWHRTPARAKPSAAKAAAAAAEKDRNEVALEKRVKAYAHFATGVIHDLNGEMDPAQDEFWKAAVADPGNEPLVIDVAQRLLQRQQAERAMELLALAAGRPSASGLVYGWLGLTQAQLGKTDLALLSDRTAIKKAPKLLLGYSNLAQLYFQRKQPQDALKVLEEAAHQPEVSATFLVDLAEILAGAARLKHLSNEEAKPRVLAALEQAAKLKPDQPFVLQKMADLYKSAGEVAKATDIYQELLRDHPSANPGVAPLLREQLFQLYIRSGDKAKATEQLKAILRDNPTNPQAYYFLGSLAAEEKDYAEAAGYYEKALLFNDKLEAAYYDLASLRLALNKPEEALSLLERARGKFNLNFFLEFYTGLAQVALKRYGDAVRSFNSAEVLAKANDPARLTYLFYFHIGTACERNGEVPEAEKHFRKCLELSPDFAEGLNYLGYMWADRGEHLEEARRMIEKAVKLEPKSSAYLDSLAWVLFKLKQPHEALPWQQQSIELSEKPDATLYDHLGDILAALGKTAEAQDAWRRALAIEPNPTIQKKLGGP